MGGKPYRHSTGQTPVWLFPTFTQRGRLVATVWCRAGWKGGRARGREEQGTVAVVYSGKFSIATSDFILKYWLKRRTAYLRAEKQADIHKELKVFATLQYHE